MTEEEFERMREFLLINPDNSHKVGVVIFSSKEEKDFYVRKFYSSLADYPFFTRKTANSCGTISTNRLLFLINSYTARIHLLGIRIDKVFNSEALTDKELLQEIRLRLRKEEKEEGEKK